MPDLTIGFSFSPRSGLWVMGLGGFSTILSPEAFLGLPKPLQRKLKSLEKSFYEEGWLKGVPVETAEDKLAIENYIKAGGLVQVAGVAPSTTLEELFS